MDWCEVCRGIAHEDLKDDMSAFFCRRYAEAKQELQQLTRLFKDACWYNFEVNCREWRHPWPETFLVSPLRLHGYRVEHTWVNGRRREMGTFPVYWAGPSGEAPQLPPEILMVELVEATKLVNMYKTAMTAPYDWAPGGSLYQKLLRETPVPTRYNYRTSSELKVCDE